MLFRNGKLLGVCFKVQYSPLETSYSIPRGLSLLASIFKGDLGGNSVSQREGREIAEGTEQDRPGFKFSLF